MRQEKLRFWTEIAIFVRNGWRRCNSYMGGDAIEARRRVPPQISRPGGTLWSVPPQILVVASSNDQNLRTHAP